MAKEKGEHYITNKEMEEELRLYRESGEMSNKLGGMFIKIATNYANKGNFAGYTWKKDMIGEAVYTCVRYAHNFDPSKQNKSNPFAYFTKICYHSFLNYIKKQKKHSKIKDVCYKSIDRIDEKQFIKKAIDYELLK